MKTENNYINKAKFFALYYGQKVFKFSPTTIDVFIVNNPCLEYYLENSCLQLKKISNISYEHYSIPDGWEFYKKYIPKIDGYAGLKIRRPYKPNELAFNEDGYKYDMIFPEEVKKGVNIDEYRSKGYVLPWMDLTVDDLIEYGWVTIIN